MSFLTNILILGSYAIVAIALTMGLQTYGNVDPFVGWLAASVFFLFASQVHGALNRSQDSLGLSEEIDNLRRALAAAERDLNEMHGRMDHVREDLDNADKKRNDKLVTEMKVLESLVQQLANGVAARAVETRDTMRAAVDAPAQDTEEEEVSPAWQVAGFDGANPSDFDKASDAQLLDVVRSSLEMNRVDLYLQPIVSLPQRRLRYYEALTRLRADDGEIIMPRHYLRVAETAGLISTIDNLLLFRCVQVVRRLIERSREVGVFCNISSHSLQDNLFFPQFLEFMESNVDLAGRLIFEFGQETIEMCGPMELANLRRLAGLGFQFSMDRVSNLQIDPEFLHDRNFRFVKVPTPVLLDEERNAASDLHIGDFKQMLSRYGLDLIAEKIEDDRVAAEVVEIDVDFGQGFLFGEPRPVKATALDEGTHEEAASGEAA